jgi:hypothetical protein
MMLYCYFSRIYCLQLQGKIEVCIHFGGEDEGSMFLQNSGKTSLFCEAIMPKENKYCST